MNRILENDALYLKEWLDTSLIKNKRILVTGASGLIGINLLAFLKVCDEDFECVCTIKNSPEKWLKELTYDERFTCVKFDLCDNLLLQNLSFEEFDIIFHLATYGQPDKMFSDKPDKNIIKCQIQTVKLNTEVIHTLFSMLKPRGIFLYMSSSEVYQGLIADIYNESMIGITNTIHPRASYIESKRAGEVICNIYRNAGYRVRILRLCQCYGAGVKFHDNRVLNKFVRNCFINNIKLRDNGTAIRTYIYVTDVIKMMYEIAFRASDIIYNVAGKEIVTIKMLAEKIASRFNKEVIIPEYNSSSIGSCGKCILDMSKYKHEFGEHDYINIDSGIDATINWFKYLHDGLKDELNE